MDSKELRKLLHCFKNRVTNVCSKEKYISSREETESRDLSQCEGLFFTLSHMAIRQGETGSRETNFRDPA